jgi:hypothetical protein
MLMLMLIQYDLFSVRLRRWQVCGEDERTIKTTMQYEQQIETENPGLLGVEERVR